MELLNFISCRHTHTHAQKTDGTNDIKTMIEEMKREVMQSRKEIKEELSVIRKLLEPRLIKRPLLEQRGGMFSKMEC